RPRSACGGKVKCTVTGTSEPPARCPGRAVLLRVLLGPRPWLHQLLRRSPGLVRSLHSDSWRSLTPRPRASSASARRLPDADRSPPGLGDAQKLLLHFVKPRRDAVVPFWME